MRKLLRPEVILLGIALVISLVAVEVGLRIFAAVSDSPVAREVKTSDPYRVQVRPDGDFGFRQSPRATFRYENGTFATANEQGYRGVLVDSVKPAGVTRIVLLGGSSTHGWGVPDDSIIDVYMRQELARRDSTRRYEVVNLAFDGYDSQQFLQRLKVDGLPRDPDIVIVNTGANDVRNSRYPNLKPRDERTLLWEEAIRRLRDEERRGGPTLGTRTKHWFYAARLPGVLRARLNAPRRRLESQQPVEPNLQAADYFEENMQQIVDVATAHGACLLMSTEPSGLHWIRPDSVSHRTYWVGTAATTQMVRDSLRARMVKVADRSAAAGKPVWLVKPELQRSGFMDDSHLLPAGYRELARILVDEIMPALRGAREAGAPPGRAACAALLRDSTAPPAQRTR